MGLLITLILLGLDLAGMLAMGWWVKSIGELFIIFVLMGIAAYIFYLEESTHPLVWRAHLAFGALSMLNVAGLYSVTRASGWLLVLLIVNLVFMLRALSRLDAESAGITYPVTFSGLAAPVQAGHAGGSADRSSHPSLPIDRWPDIGPSSAGTLSPSVASSGQFSFQSGSDRPKGSGLVSPGFVEIEGPAATSLADDLYADPLSKVSSDPDVVIEDVPEVQVELETYKEGYKDGYKEGANAVPLIRASAPSAAASQEEDFRSLMAQIDSRLKEARKAPHAVPKRRPGSSKRQSKKPKRR